MADWSKFKPEVFGSLPIAVLCLVLVLVSVAFPNWVSNGGTSPLGDANSTDSRVQNVEFGLFYGRKTKTRGGSCVRGIIWVCSDGVCMLSCGSSREDRNKDIEDLLLGPDSNLTSSEGDDQFCPQCSSGADELRVDISRTEEDISRVNEARNTSLYDPSTFMVREGMLRSVQAFLVTGILFTFVNIIFTAVNITHNPVSSIVGIDGLVLWNFIAAVSYFLVLVLWGAEYNIKLRKNLCISDTLRAGPIEWSSQSSIGWCSLLLICPMLLHMGVAGMLGYRQYKRYYSSKRMQQKEQRLAVQDPTQGGTDILF